MVRIHVRRDRQVLKNRQDVSLIRLEGRSHVAERKLMHQVRGSQNRRQQR